MGRGRHSACVVTLTAEERLTLEAWQRSTSLSAGKARRGRIILLLADRIPIAHIAALVGISRRFVYKYYGRFQVSRLDGLNDKPGRGRRAGLLANEQDC